MVQRYILILRTSFHVYTELYAKLCFCLLFVACFLRLFSFASLFVCCGMTLGGAVCRAFYQTNMLCYVMTCSLRCTVVPPGGNNGSVCAAAMMRAAATVTVATGLPCVCESDGYLAVVNEGSGQPSSGEWTRLSTPRRRFDSGDGGCLQFDYRSRFVDLDVYLLTTSSPTSHETRIVDIRHDGQVRQCAGNQQIQFTKNT